MTVRPTSIIICTHNRANSLYKIICQLRAQDYPVDKFEIIVVDHNSTDHTPKIVQQFRTDPCIKVRYVFEVRPGITFARNRGAEESQFPYLAFLDDDCSVEADWLEQLIQGFELHEDVVAVGGRVVLDWSQQERPTWLGTELDRWLAANNYLGSHARLLNNNEHIVEGNMALKRSAWIASGGFLGMEQFGSRNMAAGEVIYLLKQLYRQNGRIAFVPQAVALHCMGRYTRRRFLQRGYWQGVSDSILDYFIFRRSGLSTTIHLVIDGAAMIVLFGMSCFSYIKGNQAKGFSYLVRSTRRLGLILGGMRLAGDWISIRSWTTGSPSPAFKTR